jgi:hypothetical protein
MPALTNPGVSFGVRARHPFPGGDQPLAVFQPPAFAIETGLENPFHPRHARHQFIEFCDLSSCHLAPTKSLRRAPAG